MKRLRIVITPRAQEDVDEHALFIARDHLDAGLRFLDAFDHARAELLRHPEIGPARPFASPALSDLRIWPIPRFENWLIFYRIRIEENTLTVIRVLHAARDIPSVLEQ